MSIRKVAKKGIIAIFIDNLNTYKTTDTFLRVVCYRKYTLFTAKDIRVKGVFEYNKSA